MQLTKDSVDIGIVCVDAPAMLAFYRDVLGLEHQGDNPVPGGGTMHRLLAGTSMVKLVAPAEAPPAANPPGGIGGGTGLRYITFSVADLDATATVAEAAGHPVVRRTKVTDTVEICIIEDPDGNWVELLQMG